MTNNKKMAKVNVSGRNWKADKKKPGQGLRSWELKQAERQKLEAIKAKERELREEKEAVRQAQIEKLRARRDRKAEEERVQKLQLVMHRKRVERVRRREKRNKLLRERS